MRSSALVSLRIIACAHASSIARSSATTLDACSAVCGAGVGLLAGDGFGFFVAANPAAHSAQTTASAVMSFFISTLNPGAAGDDRVLGHDDDPVADEVI